MAKIRPITTLSWADSRFAPSQWETALLCNDVSHWLGANLESALLSFRCMDMVSQDIFCDNRAIMKNSMTYSKWSIDPLIELESWFVNTKMKGHTIQVIFIVRKDRTSTSIFHRIKNKGRIFSTQFNGPIRLILVVWTTFTFISKKVLPLEVPLVQVAVFSK